MWLIAFRNLQMRRRRFVVAILAVGLVFGITQILDGFTHSIVNEVRRTVAAFNSDSWLVARGSSGPFTADHLAPENSAQSLKRSDPSVRLGAIFALTTSITKAGGSQLNVNVVGTTQPVTLSSGRWPRSGDEVVANDDLGMAIGQHLDLSGRRFTVVGQIAHLRYFAGTSVIFMRLGDAQRLFVYGQPIVSGYFVKGTITGSIPKGLVSMTNQQVIESLMNPVNVAASTIEYLDILLWIVAAAIIGTILYMTSLERLRDFAALKAIGARNRQIFVGLAAQALVLSCASALVAWIAAKLLAPAFPMIVEIPLSSYPLTLAVAIAVGLLGSVAGVRRAMAIDPALAFGG